MLTIFCFALQALQAQHPLERRIDETDIGRSLTQLLSEVEANEPIKFYYLPEWIDKITVETDHKGLTLRETLTNLFLDTDLRFLSFGDHDVVIVKDPAHSIANSELIQAAVRERKVIQRISIGDATENKKGKRVTLKGKIIDRETKEPLNGAAISFDDLKIGTVSDLSGNFELKVPAGEHVVSFTYVNFEEKIADLQIYRDGEVSMLLDRKATVLDEIVVSEMAERKLTTSNLGEAHISIRDIKRAPAFMGEIDLIKQVQVLPGVTTSGEAASGFNVRGGSVDQNLVLYDGMPVFNTSHAFGFFSAFNAPAIRDVSFYRGGIPAEYGGRISSVLDIRSREGDREKWSASGGIGMIASNLMAGGPIKKDKTSIIVSARSTYSDWLINSIKTNYADLRKSSVSFYDGTVKLAHRFSSKTKVALSGYASRDQFRLKGDSSYQWNNVLGSIRLDHQFNGSASFDFTVGAGSYSYKVSDRNPFTGFDLSYRITYPSAKAAVHLQSGNHKLIFGLESTLYAFDPGTLQPSGSLSSIKSIQMEQQRSFESAVFLGDGISVNERFFVEAGVRLSSFTAFGPATVNLYQPGLPLETYNRTDSIRFDTGKGIKTYFGLEPRVSFRYSLTNTMSLKAGYNRTYQYLHLITNTTAVTPVDVWQPSGYYFKPQYADQFSLGLYRDLKEKKYEASIEGFYKTIENILDFKDGANLILNKHLETDLLQGRGRSYGVETSFAKTSGRLTGSVSYTYSRSFRTINGPTDRESVNHGREYPSNYDQPNVVNILWKYALSRRFYFTGNFTYRTGRPVTVPQSAYDIDHVAVAVFSDRNQYRIPDYHRLDVALIIEENHKRKKFWSGTWSFSIYNLYGRKNPYTVFFTPSVVGVLEPYQLSIIGTPLPSISYNFKF